jgi:hypothetical protein
VPDGERDALRLQVLATEHWSLLATRTMLWNESFSRTGMFLTVVSASVVGLALVGQAEDFGDDSGRSPSSCCRSSWRSVSGRSCASPTSTTRRRSSSRA